MIVLFSGAIDNLREPDNANERYAVIGAGAILGLIFSLRGRFFKKLVYTSSGAGAAAAVCYPNEAEEVKHQVVEFYKEYSSIVYHFSHAGNFI